MDTSSLTPADSVVALRSFPRRYREAAAPVDDESTDALVEQRGPTGRSVLDLAVDTTRSLSLLDRALDQILVSDRPVLHGSVRHRASREFDTERHGHLDHVLNELDDVAPALAERAARVHSDDWLREGDVAGGGTVRAIDVLREAVSTAADNLREIEATLQALRQGGS